MNKIDFMKLEEGDIIYVPYVITERLALHLVRAKSPAIADEEQDEQSFSYRDIRIAEKKRRKFLRGDIVRGRDKVHNTYESRVLEDEGNDGLVELPSVFWKEPILVDHEDLTLLIPGKVAKHLPAWPANAHADNVKSVVLTIDEGKGVEK